VFQEYEITAMLIGIGVVLYILLNHERISRIPFSKTLQSSFFFLSAGYFLTVAEGIFLGQILNLVEHLCYAASSLLLALWSFRAFIGDGTSE